MMWHEVRRQERKIRCMIVDYKRRAERRKDYYEKIKADPTQFLQVHGRPCKIHLDPTVAAAGDSTAVMMNWAGSPDVVIDRFDVRAHLDHISDSREPESDHQLTYDERYINYERYRILVQNDFLGVTEEKFLHQLHLEEQYGASTKTGFVPIEGKKKVPGAAIGYVYEDSTGGVSSSTGDQASAPAEWKESETNEEVEDDDDSDVDFDVCVDVNQVTTQQAHELNQCSQIYGMEGNDFFSFLTKDKEEADNLKLAKELEEEKAMYSGRKSRRERRAYREKKLAGRKISPPSYASRRSPTYHDYNRQLRSTSKSRSPSPENSGQITFITCFGEEEHGTEQSMSSDMRRRSPNQYGVDRGMKQKWSSSKSRHSPQVSHESQRRGNYARAPLSPGRSRGRRSPYGRGRNYGSSGDWSRGHSPLDQWRARDTPRTEHRKSAERRSRRSPRRQSPSRKKSRSPDHRRGHGSPRAHKSADRSAYSPISRSPRRWTEASSSYNYSPPPQRNTVSHSAHSNNDLDLDGYGRMSDTGSSRGSSSPPPPSKPAYRPRPSLHQQSSNVSTSTITGGSKSEISSSVPSSKQSSAPRYYGRRKEKSSSSEISWSGDEDKSSTSEMNSCLKVDSEKPTTSMGNAGGRIKAGSCSSASKMTMQERLKRKMQIMLNRQFKADKRAEKEKQERVYQERIDREDEMREISIKLRKRERMKRHEYYAELERQERRSRSSRSTSSSDSSPPSRRERRKYSRSRSRSRSSEPHRSSKGLVDY